MNLIIRIIVAIIIFWIVYAYFLPLLPEPIKMIATLLLVVAAILWLLRFGGFNV